MNACRLVLTIACATLAAFGGCGLYDGGVGPFDDAPRDATVEAAPRPDAGEAAASDASEDAPIDAPVDRDAAPIADPCRTFVVDAGGDAVAAFQTFEDPNMFGCSGAVTFPNRNALCNVEAGCVACTAGQWLAGFGDAAPRHQYWTDEVLGYFGNEVTCNGAGPGTGLACPLDHPFRVCVDGDASPPRASVDSNGNRCHFTRCGFTDAGDGGPPDASNAHFGGCSTGATAGTLCCCTVPAQD